MTSPKPSSPGDRPAGRRPAIVAELGRPETPEETATRKAETSRRHRSNQTMLNLVVALLASFAVVLLIVLVVVRPDPVPREPVDFQEVATQAQRSIDAPLASPDLPAGWEANAARVESGSDDVTSWYIGFVTPTTQFIAMRQGVNANETWLAEQLRFSRPTSTATVDGLTWQVHDNREDGDAGNLAFIMTTEVDDSIVVLSGTAPDAEFETLAAAVAVDLTGASR